VFIILSQWEEEEKNCSERLKIVRVNIKIMKIQLEKMATIYINNFYQPMLLISKSTQSDLIICMLKHDAHQL